jgi:hypothetical protein
LENNIFVVYVALLASLWSKENKTPISNWEDKLEEMLDDIDFSRTNGIWNELGLFNTNLTHRLVNKISLQFRKGVNVNGNDERTQEAL